MGKKTMPERPGAVSKPGLTTCSLHLPVMQQDLCIMHRPLQSPVGVQPICASLIFVSKNQPYSLIKTIRNIILACLIPYLNSEMNIGFLKEEQK